METRNNFTEGGIEFFVLKKKRKGKDCTGNRKNLHFHHETFKHKKEKAKTYDNLHFLIPFKKISSKCDKVSTEHRTRHYLTITYHLYG
jgi:hypothetical protein